jgi:hypothetical protein
VFQDHFVAARNWFRGSYRDVRSGFPSVTEEDYSQERRICYGSQPFA